MQLFFSTTLLAFACVTTSSSLKAEATQATAVEVTPNRTLPKIEAYQPFRLPEKPVASDFKRLREFTEPLIPVGGESSPEELQAFAMAVRAVIKDLPKTNFSPFERFLSDHPTSPWRSAIQVNLAIGYYASGWYSKSLASSGDAWTLAKSGDDPDVHRLADRALAEWLKLNSRLGRMEVLEQAFAEIKDRRISPNVGTLVTSAYEAMSAMQTKPDFCFRCGPMALKEILRAQKAPGDWESYLLATKSPRSGFSLKEVHAMSEKLGMNMQMARRAPGAEVLLPAVVHWKVGHYAALQRRLESGAILTQDLTFNQTSALSVEALDHEASGVFLVRAGALPKGWSTVSDQEASTTYGKGITAGPGPDNPDCPTPSTSCDACKGMPGYSINLMQVALTIKDTPVGYSPPVGPSIDFTLRYHESATPLDELYQGRLPFASSQIGHSWYSYIVSFHLFPDIDIRLLDRRGNWRTFRNFDPLTSTYDPEYNSGDILRRVAINPRSYELTHSDGSIDVFSVPGPSVYHPMTASNLYLSSLRDPHGNTVTLHYDAVPRLVALTDAIGQVTTFTYPPTPEFGEPSSQISRVTDPFGRFATFEYLLPERPLSRITDTLGLISNLEWDDSKPVAGAPDSPQPPPIRIVTALVTPYGRTTFQRSVSGLTRRLTATDPQGDAEVVEYRDLAPGIPPNNPNPFGGTTDWMAYRNTFHWTKEMWGHHPEDYTKAINYHWQHSTPSSLTGNALESVKKPLENRFWFTNAGQSSPAHQGTFHSPSSTARFMDDGSVQRTYTDHNSRGNVTRDVDAAGRETTYTYAANGIDLLETRRLTGNGPDDFARLSSATYNAQHLPVTTTDMAGQTTSYTWNARGQLATVTDPIGAVTTLGYNADGYLTSVNGPLPGAQDTISLTYDAYGRPATWTDVDGYMLAYQYDVMDRMTRTSYMDGTYEEYTYNRLDKATFRDREARVTSWTHNALRQLVATTDPANRTLRYEWCRCGDLRVLYDAMGRATQWKRDLQGRVTAKVYADGSQYRYDYERATSRLKRRTDAKGQFTDYQWTADDQIARISYPNAEIATPTCTYTYDPVFNRMTSAIAGPEPLYYTYHPIINSPAPGAGRLARRDGRYPDETLTYAYDARGLRSQRTFAGMSETWSYDALGRVITNGTLAGDFIYTYQGATRRMTTCAYPNGILASHTYYGSTGSNRLLRMKYEKAGAVLAQFDYTYSPVGNIATWGQKVGMESQMITRFYSYDNAYKLTGVTGPGETETYDYDPAGNRITQTKQGVTSRSAYDNLNQLVATDVDLETPQTIVWDGENRLSKLKKGTRAHEWSITRNAQGIPTEFKSPEGTQRVIYDGFRVIGLQAFGGGWITACAKSRLHAGLNEIPEFVCLDHLASCRLRIKTGVPEHTQNYDSFGWRSDEEQFFTSGFTGHTEAVGGGILVAPYRIYSSLLSRWMNRDPIEERGGINLYSYTQNNPIGSVDITGFLGEPHGHDPYSDWCTIVPDKIGQCNLQYACKMHDLCYDDPNTIRNECDLEFHKNIQSTPGCGPVVSGVYWSGVRLCGWLFKKRAVSEQPSFEDIYPKSPSPASPTQSPEAYPAPAPAPTPF